MGDEMNLIAKLPFFIGRRPSIWSHASEQPPLGERGPVQGTVADDDVVVERDVEQPSSRALLGLRHGERGDEAKQQGEGSPAWRASGGLGDRSWRFLHDRSSSHCQGSSEGALRYLPGFPHRGDPVNRV